MDMICEKCNRSDTFYIQIKKDIKIIRCLLCHQIMGELKEGNGG